MSTVLLNTNILPSSPYSQTKAKGAPPRIKPSSLPTGPRPKAATMLWPRPDSALIPEPGRITKPFETSRIGRAGQAEQILKSFRLWPPREGEVFVLQVDQDSPPPPLTRPDLLRRGGVLRPGPQEAAWLLGREEIRRYVLSYSGQLVVFRGKRVNGQPTLEELNPNGPFPSSSHPGQLDPQGQASCTGGVCGMAWLRPGAYLYRGRDQGVFNPVGDEKMKVARDLNGDGVIDVGESMRSENSHGLAIQIHAGFPGAPRSVGCQTMPPAAFEVFRRLIQSQGVETFHYLLVRRPNDRTGPHIW